VGDGLVVEAVEDPAVKKRNGRSFLRPFWFADY